MCCCADRPRSTCALRHRPRSTCALRRRPPRAADGGGGGTISATGYGMPQHSASGPRASSVDPQQPQVARDLRPSQSGDGALQVRGPYVNTKVAVGAILALAFAITCSLFVAKPSGGDWVPPHL